MDKDLPFGVTEYQERLAQVTSAVAAEGLDALLVAAPEDVFYLTGFRNMDMFRFQVLAVCPGTEPVMVLRKMATASFERTSWTSRIVTYADHQDPADALRAVLIETRTLRGRVGVPMRSPYFTPYFLDQARSAVPSAEWMDSSFIVGRERLVKSPAEIVYIRQACGYAEQAVLAGAGACRPGRTENQVAAAMLAP